MKIILGVVDNIPYAHSKANSGEVAQYLENKYHIIQQFADKHLDKIVDMALSDGNCEGINALFRQELIDGFTGIQTGAALKGVSHRLKSKKGDRRPSFIDTGIYLQSFMAELNND